MLINNVDVWKKLEIGYANLIIHQRNLERYIVKNITQLF